MSTAAILIQTLYKVHLEYMCCSFGLCIVCVLRARLQTLLHTPHGETLLLGSSRLYPREAVASGPAQANRRVLHQTHCANSLRSPSAIVYSGGHSPTPLFERPPGCRLGSSETLPPTLVAERTISALPLVPTHFHNGVGTPES